MRSNLIFDQSERMAALLSLADQTDAEISRYLGHANASSLNRLRDGESFLDSESLAKLGQYELRALAHPNLHWVLTGGGDPLLPTRDAKGPELNALCTLAKNEVAQLRKR